MSEQHQKAFDETVSVTRSFTKQEPARCGVTNEVIDFERYIVVKRDDLKFLSTHKKQTLLDLCEQIVDARRVGGLVGERKRVVISESMDCFEQVVARVTDELRQKTGVVVQDRLIRTPSTDDLLLVAKTFLGSRVHLNMDPNKYGGNVPLLIPHASGNFRDGELIPWNPWNNPDQAMELSVLIRARLGYDINGPHVEYWDEPLTPEEKRREAGEIMRVISCAQHGESGFSLSIARKLTQVAVYRAHRIQGTI